MPVSNRTRRPSAEQPSAEQPSAERPLPIRRQRQPARPTPDAAPLPAAESKIKFTLDRLLAALLLVPGLPIMALLIAAVRLTSRGPGIFRQARVGKDGRVFTLYKIRTMRHDAEDGVGAIWSTRHDPRTTRLGRCIRALHLDELPQLFNVLKGDMALVGPRPERPEFVAVLEEALPGYRHRLSVRPGITGPAQLRLPADTDLCSACRKLAVDLEYVGSNAPATDLRLLLCTLVRLPKLPLGMSLRLCGLPRDLAHPQCARCQMNGHNGHGAMTAAALRGGMAGPVSGGNGAGLPLKPR